MKKYTLIMLALFCSTLAVSAHPHYQTYQYQENQRIVSERYRRQMEHQRRYQEALREQQERYVPRNYYRDQALESRRRALQGREEALRGRQRALLQRAWVTRFRY